MEEGKVYSKGETFDRTESFALLGLDDSHQVYLSKMTDADDFRGVSTHSGRPLLVVLGPTGSGKSNLAMALAERGGEVVNFDSVQIYRGFDVGSAKLTESERRGIPHHLIDLAEADEEITAGSYGQYAAQVLADISDRGHVPVLAGGTGFYLKALLEGLSPAPQRDEYLRRRLENVWGRRPLALSRFLRRFDPETALRIHQNDRQKLVRAVEMMILEQRPASHTQALPRRGLAGYSVIKLGLNPDRKALYERIDRRTELMFENGLIEETAALLQSGIPAEAKPMQSLGYKQAVGVLSGCYSLDQAIAECQTRTRQYAKRQLTWFRREADVHWLHGFGSDAAIQVEALRIAASHMENSNSE